MNLFDKIVNDVNTVFGTTYDLPVGTLFDVAAWHFPNGTVDERLSMKIVSPINATGNVLVEVVGVEVYGNRKADVLKASKKWIGKRMRLPAHRIDTFINGR